jgi:hypothetical protein
VFNTTKAAPLFEPLEPRLFLAGDVSVQIIKGTLVITGDDGVGGIVLHAEVRPLRDPAQ